MDTVQEKAQILQKEVEIMEKKFLQDNSYTKYTFGCAILAPLLFFGILRTLNPSFIRDKTKNPDRKKVVKWTALFTIIIWAILYGVDYYLKNKVSLRE